MIKIPLKICNWKRIWVFNRSALPFKKKKLKSVFGCPESLLAHVGSLWLQRAGAALRGSAWASPCRTQALGAQAPWLWCTGRIASEHVDFSWPGIRPLFPALTGWFLSTVPPEKSPSSFLIHQFYWVIACRVRTFPPNIPRPLIKGNRLTLKSFP